MMGCKDRNKKGLISYVSVRNSELDCVFPSEKPQLPKKKTLCICWFVPVYVANIIVQNKLGTGQT